MKFLLCLLFLLSFETVPAQETIEATLGKFNRGTIPYISPEEMAGSEVLRLDARAWEEFQVSHLEGAVWVGYEKFENKRVLAVAPDKATPIVVYCSVGVRSEDIGEKLVALGYTDVKNLYGGIFEWKNKGYPVVDNSGKATEKVHAYNKRWGQLLNNAEKVY